MTNLEALKAEIEPLTISKGALGKALLDAGLDATAEYSDEKSVAKATVKALSKLMVLKSESEGKFAQSYADGVIEKRIIGICNQHGFDVSEFVTFSSITDGSNRW